MEILKTIKPKEDERWRKNGYLFVQHIEIKEIAAEFANLGTMNIQGELSNMEITLDIFVRVIYPLGGFILLMLAFMVMD